MLPYGKFQNFKTKWDITMKKAYMVNTVPVAHVEQVG